MATLKDLSNKLPVTYRQLHYWSNLGLFPGVHAEGSGNHVHLTYRQAAHVELTARLVAAGLTPVAASRWAVALLEDGAVHEVRGVKITRE